MQLRQAKTPMDQPGFSQNSVPEASTRLTSAQRSGTIMMSKYAVVRQKRKRDGMVHV